MKMLEKTDETAENEFFTYLQVNHENIVKYFDHFDHYDEENSIDYICIITEYCEVTLIKYCKSLFNPCELCQAFKYVILRVLFLITFY